MKIHGESEFTVRSDHTPADVRAQTQRALDDFRSGVPEVLAASVIVEDDYDVQVHVTLSATSYARAEAIMNTLAERLKSVLETDATTAVSGRTTELVPA